MKKTSTRLTALALCSLVITGCGDDTGSEDTGASADGTEASSEAGAEAESEAEAEAESSTEEEEATSEATGDGDGDGDAFVFDDAEPADYAQVDRMGMPAISTAVITSKDAYNADTPASDAAGDYVTEITDNLTALHAALDDDLTGLTLVPCAVTDCVGQAAPLVVPDTLKLDITTDAGFPNGRTLTDPVMDVTLAVVLLDLSVMGQDATSLVGVNPTANDVSFDDSFPYLAAAN